MGVCKVQIAGEMTFPPSHLFVEDKPRQAILHNSSHEQASGRSQKTLRSATSLDSMQHRDKRRRTYGDCTYASF